MVTVSLTGSFRPAVGGAESLQVEAQTIRQLLQKLEATHPGLRKHVAAGIAVAINGEIYRDNWDVEIAESAEVYLLPRIYGG